MKDSGKPTTREKILAVSIDLFARNGYTDVSMRDIADAVGVKASSLYKHYESKEAILNQIFGVFRDKLNETVYPGGEPGEKMSPISPEIFLKESFARFRTIMWNPEIVKIARIITMEQQRNQAVREFFIRELIEKPNRLLKQAFNTMLESNLIAPMDTGVLAEEYNAYIVSLYFEQNFLSEELNLDEIDRKMKQHNDFYTRHVLARKGEKGK